MFSSVTLYKNLPLIGENYIIDDLPNYLESLGTGRVLEFEKVQFTPLTLNNVIFLPVEPNNLEVFKNYNYAVIKAENYKTGYYFIKNIERVATGNARFDLVLDVLNTYNNLNFYFNTFVIREHVDRWNYKGLYYNKLSNTLFLLRNFPDDSEEDQPKSLKFNGFFYPDTSTSKRIKNNYWVKIKIKDKAVGIRIAFINLFNSFNVLVNGNIHVVESFTDLGAERISALIQNTDEIIEIELDPYPPHEKLRNVGVEEFTIDSKDLQTFDLLNFQITTDKTYNYVFLSTTFYITLLDLKTLNIPLLKYANNLDIWNTLTGLLFNILVTKVPNALTLMQTLVNGLSLGGAFSNFTDEKREYNNFFYVNEPSVLKSNYLNININFLTFEHNLLIEKIKLLKGVAFNEFCDEINQVPKNLNNLIISLFFKVFYFSNGGVFYFEPGKYFDYVNYNGNGEAVKYFTLLPTITNEAIKYEKEAQLKRIEEENKAADRLEKKPDRSVWQKGFDFVSAQADMVQNAAKKLGPRAWAGLKKGVTTFVRTGNPIKSAISAGVGFLFNEESKNNKNAAKTSTFEEGIIKNEFKAIIQINQVEKVDTLELTHYLTGNLVNCYKIPTHNNRVYFDFLQCNPVFKDVADATPEIIEELNNLYSSGVYYIHKVRNSWTFPFENIENIEVKAVEYFKSLI